MSNPQTQVANPCRIRRIRKPKSQTHVASANPSRIRKPKSHPLEELCFGQDLSGRGHVLLAGKPLYLCLSFFWLESVCLTLDFACFLTTYHSQRHSRKNGDPCPFLVAFFRGNEDDHVAVVAVVLSLSVACSCYCWPIRG